VAIDAVIRTGAVKSDDYRVTNLSAGGALIVGRPQVEIGERIDLQLMISKERALELHATVVRIEHESKDVAGIALAFRELSARDRQTLEKLVEFSLESSRARGQSYVLVVDGEEEMREAMQRDLSALGRRAASAGFFLNALRWLQDPAARI